jgi:hypothetical protein
MKFIQLTYLTLLSCLTIVLGDPECNNKFFRFINEDIPTVEEHTVEYIDELEKSYLIGYIKVNENNTLDFNGTYGLKISGYIIVPKKNIYGDTFYLLKLYFVNHHYKQRNVLFNLNVECIDELVNALETLSPLESSVDDSQNKDTSEGINDFALDDTEKDPIGLDSDRNLVDNLDQKIHERVDGLSEIKAINEFRLGRDVINFETKVIKRNGDDSNTMIFKQIKMSKGDKKGLVRASFINDAIVREYSIEAEDRLNAIISNICGDDKFYYIPNGDYVFDDKYFLQFITDTGTVKDSQQDNPLRIQSIFIFAEGWLKIYHDHQFSSYRLRFTPNSTCRSELKRVIKKINGQLTPRRGVNRLK